jgi:hypothetical protein
MHNRPTGRSASGLQSPGSAPHKEEEEEEEEYLGLSHLSLFVRHSY